MLEINGQEGIKKVVKFSRSHDMLSWSVTTYDKKTDLVKVVSQSASIPFGADVFLKQDGMYEVLGEGWVREFYLKKKKHTVGVEIKLKV